MTVKKKGETRIVTKTNTKYVLADFMKQNPAASQKADMPLKDYVIGGMDPGFRLKLYHALRAMDAAGLMPGITSAFRDNYRQSIAVGNKAATDSSYHGGSRRGGYGHGLAADLVSVKGETRQQSSLAPAKSYGSGSMRARRSSGSGVRISVEIRRMSGRSTARNLPTSAAGRRRNSWDQPRTSVIRSPWLAIRAWKDTRSKSRTGDSGKHLASIEMHFPTRR